MMIVALSESRAWSTQVDRAGLELRVLAGTVWVTQEGDVEDHVLEANGAFVADRSGRVAIQALTPARVEVKTAVPSSGPLAAAA